VVAGREFAQRLMSGKSSLGEAAIAAKALAGEDVRRTWILFGDPTLHMAPESTAKPKQSTGGCDCRLATGANTASTPFERGPLACALVALALTLCLRRRTRR
jgi:hypothetical protein